MAESSARARFFVHEKGMNGLDKLYLRGPLSSSAELKADKHCIILNLFLTFDKVPSGEVLTFGDDNFMMLEEEGIREAQNVAFVLVAGGLGERLGYKGIKLITQTSMLQSLF
ncbi:UDP-sugar pyrophosphorylase-like [Asparagus officinalis]|uniref:UDP-sugar pyrophosphorylase-like n=1 Tax=Asparagus officinalis TaxID=4686 RepID=UPI00098E767E|nr:UDP-sugar pyrophosphorylase-like [Asparagus officinalis]